MKFPEHYRKEHPLGFKHKTGDNFGWFFIPSVLNQNHMMAVQANADFGDGWEHVSVSLRNRCPVWEEMCQIKNLFWDEDESVIQIHPPKQEYINNAKFCLHLWRYKKSELPRPDSICVGVK